MLPQSGGILISVSDREKAEVVPIARRLAAHGYEVYATEGTATILRAVGIEVAGVPAKVSEGEEGQGTTTDLIRDGRVHAVVSGSVGSVEAAVQAGEEASRRAGEFHAALVLPQPEAEVGVLLPSIPPGDTPTAAALGIVEATGYAGSVAAVDGMVKGGRVDLERLTIGSGGRVAAIASGSLDEVGAAVAEGARRAGETAELEGQVVISGPDPQVVGCFARPGESPGARNLAGRALGLVETRTTAGLVKALDEMLKNADVAYEGRYKAGYFLTACVVRGETGAVDTALEVARRTVGPYGELVAAHAIHLPYDEMETRLPHG